MIAVNLKNNNKKSFHYVAVQWDLLSQIPIAQIIVMIWLLESLRFDD